MGDKGITKPIELSEESKIAKWFKARNEAVKILANHNLLPSELLAQRDELIEALENVMIVTFEAETRELAQETLNKIKGE